MKSSNSIDDCIITALKLLNSSVALHGQNEKLQMLFVEGLSDQAFYHGLFSQLKSAYPDLDCSIETPTTVDFNSYGIATITHVMNCDLVKRIGELFCKNNQEQNARRVHKELSNIECFGFVDRDFKDDREIKGRQYSITNNAYTVAHDLETSVFYLVFPLICSDEKKNNKSFVKKLSILLEFLGKQGVLQKCSIDTKSEGIVKQVLEWISYLSFLPEKNAGGYRDCLNRKGLDSLLETDEIDVIKSLDLCYEGCTSFDFDNHFKKAKKVLDSCQAFVLYSFLRNIFSNFHNRFSKVVNYTFPASFDFYKETELWLSNKDSQLKKVLQFANGHLLEKCFISAFRNDFSLFNKEDCHLMDLFKVNDQTSPIINAFSENAPTSLYLDYRKSFAL